MPRVCALVLTSAVLLWAVLLLAAPLAVAEPTWGLARPAAVVYLSASQFCHQLPERSCSVSGVQLPVCARCTALYLSALLGTVLAWSPGRRRPPPPARLVLTLCALPTAATWGLEHLAGVPFSNLMRAIAAVPLGLSVGWICMRLLLDEPTYTRGSRVPAPEPRAIS